MNTYKKNDVVRLAVERCGNDGEGIAHLDGQVVFVAGGITGEICDVQLLKIGKTALWGRAVKIVEPSPHRLPSDCPYFPKCGGCQFRHMSYEAELNAKRQRVEDALKRIGGVDLPVSVIHGAENTDRYRNKVQLPVSEGPAIGFFRARSHDVVNVDDCLLQPEAASAACEAVRVWMTRYEVPAYDETAHKGLVRHVFLRFSRTHVLCCLVVNGDKLPHTGELIAALREAVPNLSGVVLSENADRTNVVLGRRLRTLWGNDYLDDTLCGLTFRISVPSFYQVNRDQTEVLYGKALEFAELTGSETVLDLYCGIGTISLCLAQKAGKVIGAEVVPSAVEDARENAARNGVKNAEFICADAGEAAAKLALDGVRPDVICVDPPRKGLAPEVIDAMAEMSPGRIVYVSCDSATLARDVKRLSERGYRAVKAVAVDMFPRTGHVETCVLLSHKNS
ncbi:MAG: 23S rRNA (uracil(1939)-C(5))-methyltransferase RlmD [Clostridia bacterium]|nr:23S rRNA (uracil(1939)-C(5))-methyltransferase RlmD [Clostridia bacterium]